MDISIHALREEGDRGRRHPEPAAFRHFYPRPPRGGRPGLQRPEKQPLRISIHALREEGDVFRLSTFIFCFDFYPRPPRGGRRCSTARSERRRGHFYPRPPRGGRPLARARCRMSVSNFYPRPPRGGRLARFRRVRSSVYFYPRPPRGGRLPAVSFEGSTTGISIHALREEGDPK